MQVWNVLHAVHWKYRTQKNRQKFAICAPSHNFDGLYLCNYRQSEKNLLDSNISPTSSQYDELRPTSGWDWFVSLGHPSKFQRFCVLASLQQRRRSTEANQTLHVCLAIFCAGTLYIHFRGLLPHNGTLCVQVLRSPILAVLLCSTRVVGVSQTLRHWAEGATHVRQGGHHVGHWLTFQFNIKLRKITCYVNTGQQTAFTIQMNVICLICCWKIVIRHPSIVIKIFEQWATWKPTVFKHTWNLSYWQDKHSHINNFNQFNAH